jgi:hypothetical protein
MKYLKYTFLLIFFLSYCKKEQLSVVVENRTAKYLYCVLSTVYPDTTISFINSEELINQSNYLVAPNSSSQITNIDYCDHAVWSTFVRNDTLLLFAIDKDVVDYTSWATIINKYMVYKRLKISYDKLSGNSCTIVVE